MTTCSYIYDTDGLRWEDGNVFVEIHVDGKSQLFSVVRNGQGRSRFERFADRTHRLDTEGRKILGEITTADLARICANGELKLGGLTDASGPTMALTLPSLPAGQHVARCDAVVVSEHGEFVTTLEPRRCAGTSGRTDDYDRLSSAFERRPAGQRSALALAQFATMPMSGRAGGPAARSRLLVAVEHVSNVAFDDATKANPDILLHLTPASFAVMSARHDEAEAHALAALVERARNDDPQSQPANVVLLLDALAAGSERTLVDAVLARIAEEVTAHHGSSYALELLVREGAVTQIWDTLETAAGGDPSRVYTFEMVSMLSRVDNDNARTVLDKIARAHAETLVDQPLTMYALPENVRALAITGAPLRALETVELTTTEVAQACAALVAQLATSNELGEQSELTRRIEALPAGVRSKVLTSLGSADGGAVVVAGTRRLEAQRRARLRGTVRELQRLAEAARKDVNVLGDRLRTVGDSCLEQARNAPLAMLSVRHRGLPDPSVAVRFERNRRVLEETLAERRVNIAKRIEDLRAAVTLLDGHVEDEQTLADIREAVMSLRSWYRRQEENLDAIRYPRSHIEPARLNAAGRELVEVGGRIPAEIAVRVEDLSSMLETLIER